MHGTRETTLKAFSDGFGCMAVTDVGDTDEDVVNALIEDSPWEIIDGVEKLPKGHYEIQLNVWWEDNSPDSGPSLITEMTGHTLLEL